MGRYRRCFSTVWLRDVPFNVPSFGDAGQVFDPFVDLGLLAAQTRRIALGVHHLRRYLETLEGIGINHVALNLRFNRASIDDTLYRLADGLLPAFSCHEG